MNSRLFFCLLLLLSSGQALAQLPLEAPVVKIGVDTGEVGTGILVQEKSGILYILTAEHVTEEYDKHAIPLLFWDGSSTVGELHRQNEDLEVAIVRCPIPIGYTVPPPYLISNDPIQRFQSVITIGHPYGQDWDVNNQASIKETTINFDRRFFTLTNTGIQPGCSGGPILNDKFELIGILYAISNTDAEAISADLLMQICQRWGISLAAGNPSVNAYSTLTSGSQIDLPTQIDLADYGLPSYLFRYVEGGSFKMGSMGGNVDEQPIHQVEVSDFMMGETEVTQALWTAIMGSNPSQHKQANHPVEAVSWYECQQFINRLNSLTGLKTRLPTEAEWEYAANGGKGKRSKYAGTNDINEVYRYANFDDRATPGDGHDISSSVRSYLPNSLKLYDMSGNVWEWCQDWYSATYYQYCQNQGIAVDPQGPSSGSLKVMRGGAFWGYPKPIRIVDRKKGDPSSRGNNCGLRLVLDQ